MFLQQVDENCGFPDAGQAGKPNENHPVMDQELAEWVEPLHQLGREAQTTYVMFNNCHFGQAVRDAIRMEELFRGE